jgi:broad specificity phosphatase PhoE
MEGIMSRKRAAIKIISFLILFTAIGAGLLSGCMYSDKSHSGILKTPHKKDGSERVKPGLTVYFIRHAETIANVTDDYSDENQNTFSEKGLIQIDKLTDYLLNRLKVTPDAIFVSPRWRTQKTIEPYLKASGTDAVIWAELDECCYQDASGSKPGDVVFEDDIIKPFAQNILVSENHKNCYFWKTDTFEQGVFMVQTLKDKIVSQFGGSGKTIFLVGHYLSGNVLMALLQKQDMTVDYNHSNPHEVWIKNTGVSKLVQNRKNGEFLLTGLNINNP